MGILEFFSVLSKDNITLSSIRKNYKDNTNVNIFMIDFNSIIHNSLNQITAELNDFLKSCLNEFKNDKKFSEDTLKKIKKYHLEEMLNNSNIKNLKDIAFYIKYNIKLYTITELTIELVINNLLEIYKTFINKKSLNTLYIAFDGVPSKAKMIEQIQRSYMTEIRQEIKNNIMNDYKDTLISLGEEIYLYEKYHFDVKRILIKPGTIFMDLISKALKSNTMKNHTFKIFPNLKKYIISDCDSIGEGEKKIINYLIKYYQNNNDSNIMIYSPDADMILLSLFLRNNNIHYLRYNQQSFCYDLIDIFKLKNNIIEYVKSKLSHANIDHQNIIDDIILLATLFGNDFVPKIPTFDIKSGFKKMLDIYLNVREQYSNLYLVKKLHNQRFTVNFFILKIIFKKLVDCEDNYLKYLHLYNTFVDFGKIQNIFYYIDFNKNSIYDVCKDFKNKFCDLKSYIINNCDCDHLIKDEKFMESLKMAISYRDAVIEDCNLSYLSNTNMIQTLKKIYKEKGKLPKLNFSLNKHSNSITDQYHANRIKNLNDYEIEIYKLDNLIGKYRKMLNAYNLDEYAFNNYYKYFFGTNDKKDISLIVDEYIYNIMWIFDYYFNSKSYVSYHYYQHKRVPLLRDISNFLENISPKKFHILMEDSSIKSINLNNYFQPIEQLIYVTPLTKNNINLLFTKDFAKFLKENKKKLSKYFINIKQYLDIDCNYKFDCRNQKYINKTILTYLHVNDYKTDREIIKLIRNYKKNDF